MTRTGWIQILLYAIVILAVTKPIGIYMFRIFEGDRQPLPRFFGPIERLIYRLCGVDPKSSRIGNSTVLRCCSSAPSRCRNLRHRPAAKCAAVKSREPRPCAG